MIDETLIKQFASQYSLLPQQVLTQLETNFRNLRNKDNVRGLIEGYAHSREIIANNGSNQNALSTIGSIMAFLSRKYLDL